MVKPATAATVPRAWVGETAVIIAPGPSLTADDVAYCRGKARLIAVKDAIRLVPFADCLYGCDADFWVLHKGFPDFHGLKYSLDPGSAVVGAAILRNTGECGLELEPSGLRTGKNSTYQAINLAVHLGVRRIRLLGVDMGHAPHSPKYFYGDRPSGRRPSPYHAFILQFQTLVEPLAELDIEVLNCSRVTALTCFPRVPLHEAL